MAKLFGFIPGLKFEVSLNKEEFTEGCAQAVGARAYASTKQLTGKAYDSGEKVVEAGAEAKKLADQAAASCAEQAKDAIANGVDKSKDLAHAAISEVTDLGKDVMDETKSRAKAAVDETVVKPVQLQLLSALDAGEEIRSEVHNKVNKYCGKKKKPMKNAAPGADQPGLPGLIKLEVSKA